MINFGMRYKNKKGQTSLESAFAFIIVLALLVFLWDGINVGYNWVTLQFVLSRGLRDVQMGRDQGQITANIQSLAANLNIDDKMVQNVNFGSPGWYRVPTRQTGTANLVEITIERTVNFGPFLTQVCKIVAVPPQVLLRVRGYAETPP